MRSSILLAAISLLLFENCSRSNNLLLGHVRAVVGGHEVDVTDCYRMSFDPPERVAGTKDPTYRFRPCRDADVLIEGNWLHVNGKPYGYLRAWNSVLVDHGVVSIRD